MSFRMLHVVPHVACRSACCMSFRMLHVARRLFRACALHVALLSFAERRVVRCSTTWTRSR
jgi:hypothetical protein